MITLKRGLPLLLSALAGIRATAPAQQPPTTVLIREGTEVKLKFAEEVSSKSAAVDDPIMLTLDEDILVGDVIAVKAGAKAYAIVSNSKKAGFVGKAGELNIRLDYLRTESTKVKLRGTKAKTGEDKTGTAIALTVLLGPVGLIKHGKDIDIKAGTSITAFVADDSALPALR